MQTQVPVYGSPYPTHQQPQFNTYYPPQKQQVHQGHQPPQYFPAPPTSSQVNSVIRPLDKLIHHYAPTSSTSHTCSNYHSPIKISYWSWGSNYYQGGSSNFNDRQTGLGIVLSLIAIGVGYFVGKELGNVENADLALKKLNLLDSCDLTATQRTTVSLARVVISDVKDSAVKSAILKISALAGLVLAAVGAFISGGSSLIALGLTVTLITGLILVIKAGINASTNYNNEKYAELLDTSQKIRALIYPPQS